MVCDIFSLRIAHTFTGGFVAGAGAGASTWTVGAFGIADVCNATREFDGDEGLE